MPGVLHYPNYLIPCRRRRKRSVYTRELSQTVINDEGTRSNEILSFSLSASDVAFCALLPTKTPTVATSQNASNMNFMWTEISTIPRY
jgi:hypothetical protein